MKIKKGIDYFNTEIKKLEEIIENTTDMWEQERLNLKILQYREEIKKLKFPNEVGRGGHGARGPKKNDKRKDN